MLFVEVGLGTKRNDTYSPLPLSGKWSRGTKKMLILKRKKSLVNLTLNGWYAHICLSELKRIHPWTKFIRVDYPGMPVRQFLCLVYLLLPLRCRIPYYFG